jgi:hypothetical protein
MTSIVMREEQRYVLALSLHAGPVQRFGDACCCAAALLHHEGRLYPFDKALSRAPGIRRSEEPFRD